MYSNKLYVSGKNYYWLYANKLQPDAHLEVNIFNKTAHKETFIFYLYFWIYQLWARYSWWCIRLSGFHFLLFYQHGQGRTQGEPRGFRQTNLSPNFSATAHSNEIVIYIYKYNIHLTFIFMSYGLLFECRMYASIPYQWKMSFSSTTWWIFVTLWN